jgi:hypothetical protein
MRVRARLELSGSNPSLCKCAYFIKKLYLGSRRRACDGGVGWDIFYFAVFEFFLIFLFSENRFVGAG